MSTLDTVERRSKLRLTGKLLEIVPKKRAHYPLWFSLPLLPSGSVHSAKTLAKRDFFSEFRISSCRWSYRRPNYSTWPGAIYMWEMVYTDNV